MPDNDVMGSTEPVPVVKREVEPETLVSTVQAELTVIPEVEDRAELQVDANPGESPSATTAEIDGGIAGDAVATEDVAGGEPPSAALDDDADPVRTHGRLKTWVIVTAILGIVGAVAFASTFTPIFAADTVRVEGAAHLSAAQVRRIAKVQPGVNVFRLDVGQAERRLERNAWVADAAITTTLPSGVTIVVRERVPAAVAVTDASGARSIVAADGTVLAPAPEGVGLPLVEAADGIGVPSEAQRVLGGSIAASLPPVIVSRVESVRVGTDGTAEVILMGGVPVSYGDASALAQKGQALRALLRWAERTGVHLGSADVRTPGAPTAVLAGGATVVPQA
jgi:cell division septal protein FtsQ